ncbi:MAG: biopolymer transporter ExbD [Muribaculaceae bacterium]|nr:biopolymer transporter ExbD [Muribaculaceae bacterium]
MAQIEQSDNKGKKKKGAQKKMSIHVDFTPMVDMNMLLITFFMLCTTMIKSQTLNISLPSNEKVEQSEMNKAKDSEAVTLILDAKRDNAGDVLRGPNAGTTVYYYEGKPVVPENYDPKANDGISSNLDAKEFLGNDGKTPQGIRKILHDKNETVLERINEQKQLWREKKITEEEYQKLAKEIRNDSTLTRPVVIIKATPDASWASVITALDEMQINQISRYQIDQINHLDSMMIKGYRQEHGLGYK